MKNLLLVAIVLITSTSCGSKSSPEKRMNLKNHDLEQKVELIGKQQQILRDSISVMNKRIDSLNNR